MFRHSIIILIIVFGLAACSTTKDRDTRDGAPAVSFDASTVDDAIPAPVVRTRAGNPPSYTILGKTYHVLADSQGYRERGLASWYGTKFHGRNTSNGEVYNMYAMTAAHKTLPIPSYVRVTNVQNGVSIVVRINDRGPFHDGRIIDLSYAAAIKLGIDQQGVGLVDVVDVTPAQHQIVEPTVDVHPTTSPAIPVALASPQNPLTEPSDAELDELSAEGDLYLQLAAFSERRSALLFQAKVEGAISMPVTIVAGQDQLHRVKLGPIDNKQKIPVLRRILKEQGFDQGHLVRR